MQYLAKGANTEVRSAARLTVPIERADERCRVFSNLRPQSAYENDCEKTSNLHCENPFNIVKKSMSERVCYHRNLVKVIQPSALIIQITLTEIEDSDTNVSVETGIISPL